MAFVGRMNSRGKFIDCEMFSGNQSKRNTNPIYAIDEECEMGSRHTKCSRTYIKSYDSVPRDLVSSPSTVRYVGHSASSCDLNSMDDTEMSTLRCTSPRSLETETATLTPENSTDNSSLSEGSGEPAVTAVKAKPRQHTLLKQCEIETQPLERGSTTSMCSWEEEEEEEEGLSMYTSMDSQATGTDTRSCCVPLLELGSDAASVYFDQQTQLDQIKLMRRSNEAYDNWLSGKKRQFQYKQQAAREQRQLKLEEVAMRQQLNEQRVHEWCERKARQCTSSTSKPKPNTDSVQPQLDRVAQRHLQGWELKKMQQAEQRRQLQQREALQKQQEQQQRKQQSALAWQRWIQGVAQRPKPVPLNQGLETLRGTISNIYINPNQWVHVNEKTRT